MPGDRVENAQRIQWGKPVNHDLSIEFTYVLHRENSFVEDAEPPYFQHYRGR